MFKRSLSALCAIAVVSSIVVAPNAAAKDVQMDKRNGKDICVVKLDSSEQEIAKEYFTKKIEEQTKLQNRMRADFPEYADLFAQWDSAPTVGSNSATEFLLPTIEDLENKGYDSLDARYLFFTNSDIERDLKDWAQKGYPYVFEVARNWSSKEMEEYPFTEVPVIVAQNGEDETGAFDSARHLPSVYPDLTLGFLPSPKLNSLMSPGKMRLTALEEKFEDVAGMRSFMGLPGAPSEGPARLCDSAYVQKAAEEEQARKAAAEKAAAEKAAAEKAAAEKEAAEKAAAEKEAAEKAAAEKAAAEKEAAEKAAAEEQAKKEAAEKEAAEKAAAEKAAAEKKAAEKKAAEEQAKKEAAEKAKKQDNSGPKQETDPDGSSADELSGEEIAGIVVGILALVLGVGAGATLIPQVRELLHLQ